MVFKNILGWYVKILTIPYRGGWVVWKRPKTPLRNIKMAPYRDTNKKKYPTEINLKMDKIVYSRLGLVSSTLDQFTSFGRPLHKAHVVGCKRTSAAQNCLSFFMNTF